ncbi:hypothetical protein, partial [Mycobacterium sp.]|uniref:hypothetical protein n=1 Tax=Mycobacterium sp. TaxID=1785 RepID=UPI0025FD6336
ASVRPEPGSNSPNKNHSQQRDRIQIRENLTKARHQKLASKKSHTPTNGKNRRHDKKQQQKQNHQTHY